MAGNKISLPRDTGYQSDLQEYRAVPLEFGSIELFTPDALVINYDNYL